MNPADRMTILITGSGEARVNLVFGLMVSVLPLSAAGVCLGRALTLKVSSPAVAGGLVLGLGIAVAVGGLAAQQGRLVVAETEPTPCEAIVSPYETGRAEATQTALLGLGVGAPLCLLGGALLGVGARKAKQAQ